MCLHYPSSHRAWSCCLRTLPRPKLLTRPAGYAGKATVRFDEAINCLQVRIRILCGQLQLWATELWGFLLQPQRRF